MPPIIAIKNGAGEIYIFGEIAGAGRLGFSATALQAELSRLSPNTPLTVYINSMGGEVFESLAIYNLLRQWKGPVTTINVGMAASMASIIFLAGSVRKIYDNAMVMTHDAATVASGTSRAIEDVLDLLRKASENMREIYKARTGASDDVVDAWMSRDTFFDAAEALQAGLATEIIANPEIGRIAACLSDRLLSRKRSESVFEAWLQEYCEAMGQPLEGLTDDQRLKLKAMYDKALKKVPPPLPAEASGNGAEDPLSTLRQREAREAERISAIHDVAARFDKTELNEEYLRDIGVRTKTVRGLASHAIRQGWSEDRFELECRRAEKLSLGEHVAIHSRGSDIPYDVYVCALVRHAGVAASGEVLVNPDLGRHGSQRRMYGYEHMGFSEQTLDASDRVVKDISLCTMLDKIHIAANGFSYPGNPRSDSFIKAIRESLWSLRAAGNTSWSGLNIFNDVANKILWSAYESVPSTWQSWVKQVSVNDFKTNNSYRLTLTGGYRPVAADGELQHGGFSDDKYTHSAKTFGQIVGLSRTDIINDDLGALSDIMGALGTGGAEFLEELFYVHLMENLTTLFPTNDANMNYISGAASDLGVDGLTMAETKGANQVSANFRPIMSPMSLLLVGTQDAVIAAELFTQTQLQGLQTANSKVRPDQNPHVGKFTPVKSPYLNNSAIKRVSIGTPGGSIPNQNTNQWLLLRSPGPSGGLVIGSFLNGNTRPIIEQGDPNFDVLGLQWRAYHDAGADNGDPKFGVYSKGTA